LSRQVRKSVTIDWTERESAKAKIRVMVRRILRKHGYPPDLQEEATKTVLAQAELPLRGLGGMIANHVAEPMADRTGWQGQAYTTIGTGYFDEHLARTHAHCAASRPLTERHDIAVKA